VNAEPIAISKNHVYMNKFASASDEDFKTISSHLHVMVKAATENADKNWKRYGRNEGE